MYPHQWSVLVLHLIPYFTLGYVIGRIVLRRRHD